MPIKCMWKFRCFGWFVFRFLPVLFLFCRPTSMQIHCIYSVFLCSPRWRGKGGGLCHITTRERKRVDRLLCHFYFFPFNIQFASHRWVHFTGFGISHCVCYVAAMKHCIICHFITISMWVVASAFAMHFDLNCFDLCPVIVVVCMSIWI